MEKKNILLHALIVFEKVNSHAASVAAATRLHDSHDKVTGEKRQHRVEHPFVASCHWMTMPGRVFHEAFFFFFVAWKWAIAS